MQTSDAVNPTPENAAENPQIASKTPITGLTQAELKAHLQAIGKEGFRAQQVFQWVYQRMITDFDQMSNVSKDLRQYLKENFSIERPELEMSQISEEDGSRKFLFKLKDGKTVESVLIPANGRMTLCISSQVGCAMACRFCNTGDMGLVRHLKTHEIVDQVLEVSRRIEAKEFPVAHRLSNIVFMGMGEPLHNLDNVCNSLDIVTNNHGLQFSHRRITVSTSGLVKQMLEFGRRSKANLAVSLNATTDELRDEIMPVNKKYNLATLLQACRDYPLDRRRRITFEYVVFKGLNDSDEEARRIMKVLQGIPSKVNLIPYNPHPASEYLRPDLKRVRAMQRILLDNNWNCTVRISKGKDILAACGQLRSLEAKQSKLKEMQKRRAGKSGKKGSPAHA